MGESRRNIFLLKDDHCTVDCTDEVNGRERDGGRGRKRGVAAKVSFVYIFFAIEQKFYEKGKKNKNVDERMSTVSKNRLRTYKKILGS